MCTQWVATLFHRVSCTHLYLLTAADEYQMSRYGRDSRYDREPEIDSYRERSQSNAKANGEAFYLGAEPLGSDKMLPHRDCRYYNYHEGGGYPADSAESTGAGVYEVRNSIALSVRVCMCACKQGVRSVCVVTPGCTDLVHTSNSCCLASKHLRCCCKHFNFHVYCSEIPWQSMLASSRCCLDK